MPARTRAFSVRAMIPSRSRKRRIPARRRVTPLPCPPIWLSRACRRGAGGPGSLGGFYEQAFRMLSSPVARRAFNLDLEAPAVRDRYGRNEYGESFLLARRLVEAGVRLVQVTWMYIFPTGRVSNVWDNHAGFGIHGAKTGYDLLKGPVCIPPLDQGLFALLEDLALRGLL